MPAPLSAALFACVGLCAFCVVFAWSAWDCARAALRIRSELASTRMQLWDAIEFFAKHSAAPRFEAYQFMRRHPEAFPPDVVAQWWSRGGSWREFMEDDGTA